MEEKKVFQLLLNYRKDNSARVLHRYFEEKSFLEILHVDRKENYHSHFLKWLFEDSETFAAANESLLYLLIRRSSRQEESHFPDGIKKALLVGGFTINYVAVRLEDKVTNGRSDIVIDMNYHVGDNENKDFHVIIENKVYSTEHNAGNSDDAQTTSYFNYYQKNYGDENMLCVYLTPVDSATLNMYDNAECACKQFIQINYQDLLDDILLPLSKDESLQQRKRFIIEEYMKGLSINYSQNSSIMAMTEELRKLLEEFWNNNQELIELSIDALSQDPLAGDEEKTEMKEVAARIKQLNGKGPGKDNTHYSINGDGNYGKGPLIYEIVKRYVEKKGEINIQDLQEKFSYSWRGKTPVLGNMIVIDENQYDEQVKGNASRDWRWKELRMETIACYVNNQWGNREAMKNIISRIKNIQELEDLIIKEKD